MKYWRGYMSWPIRDDWKCETCGKQSSLTWGIVHAVCRCDNCHTEYYMRGEDGEPTDTPICQLKPEYKAPAKKAYELYHSPMSEWTDDMWDRAIEECK